MSVYAQPYWNDHLWELKEQYDQVFVKAPNASTSPECMDQIRFFGCHYAFPGCDRSTSAFKPKKFCKDSCLHFTNECSTFLKAWKDIYLSGNPDEAYLFSCLKRPLRNAGDSPECVYYERNESLEKEGMLVDRRSIGMSFSPGVSLLAGWLVSLSVVGWLYR